MTTKICFATSNQNKIKEVQAMLDSSIELVSLTDIGCTEELAETCSTIEGNSAQKASYVYENYGIACFADDTGLEVEALNGAPGVYSARYAGEPSNAENNMNLLLENMAEQANKLARFKTVVTYVAANGNQIQFEGIVEGKIISERKGGKGFGYDPIFVPNGYDITYAEMDLAKKNEISHRALAVKMLVEYLTKV